MVARTDLAHEQQKGKWKDERKKGESKGKSICVFSENHLRGGGEENERQLGNNVMQEMRFYDGYLVGLM